MKWLKWSCKSLGIDNKTSVNLRGLDAPMLFGMYVIIDTINKFGYMPVVTSACDGKHSVNSLHYSGNAVDIRSHYFSTVEKHAILDLLKKRLFQHGFDCILECENTPNEHYHIEYDPKNGRQIKIGYEN